MISLQPSHSLVGSQVYVSVPSWLREALWVVLTHHANDPILRVRCLFWSRTVLLKDLHWLFAKIIGAAPLAD